MLGYQEVSFIEYEYNKNAYTLLMYENTKRDKVGNDDALTKIGVGTIEEKIQENNL